MRNHNGHQEAVTDSRAVGSDARAARSEAAGEGRLTTSRPGSGERPGLGGLWLLLVPLACCGGPLLIASLAAAWALAWGALGLGAGVLVAVTVLVIRRRRRSSRACCKPGMTGRAPEAGTAAARRPPAR
ncbi:MAG TPA: hypothetical protein VF933_37205 [Streptosporangiaceae bacterium]